jgi:hypothetical protein
MRFGKENGTSSCRLSHYIAVLVRLFMMDFCNKKMPRGYSTPDTNANYNRKEISLIAKNAAKQTHVIRGSSLCMRGLKPVETGTASSTCPVPSTRSGGCIDSEEVEGTSVAQGT